MEFSFYLHPKKYLASKKCSGGIIRGERGNHIISFSHYPGTGNVILAELWALQIEVHLAINQGIQNLEIESDSNSAVQLMNDNNLPNTSNFFNVISNCKCLLLSLKQWKISHCYREANRCAAALANHGKTSKLHLSIHQEPPPFLFTHLLHDEQSYHLPRQVPTPHSNNIDNELEPP
ncbi:reverse transcriptase [Senna tora]|uniref:Reverse transcriptase n=1 Tax=Senna tora TaxID=362788 RepID=A0A834SVI9_9FABA|nr:reverse transcriptase [Senna tora]